MSALKLIARLRDLNIRISEQSGELEVDAPQGALTAELRDEIIALKPDLLRILSWSRRSRLATDIALEPVSRDQPLPLSWAQQRLWFLDQLEPESSAYNIAWTVRLKGELDVTAMQAAFNDLVQRHETLRTCFPVKDGQPAQKIKSKCSLPLQAEDLGSVSEEKLRTRLGQIAALSFSLETGPLIRVALLKLSSVEHILLVVIHHIVSDGASMRVLFRELAAYYEERLTGEPAALQDLPVQYADFAVWQRNWLGSEELKRQSDYWLRRLDDLPPLLELPWDRPRAAAMRYRGASVLRLLPASLAGDLRSLSRAHGCTLFMTMLTAFFVLLMRYSGREDLVVGTPMGGRSRTSLEGLIGFFINTVVLRSDLSGDPAFSELLKRVRNVALEAHANQDLPFEKLVELLQPARELSYSPVFQVMFDLQEEPRWKLPVKNLEVIPEVVFSSRTSSFDLTLSIRQAEYGLDAMFEYDTDLFDEVSIERMAVHYETLLEAIVQDANRPISRLSLVDAGELRRLEHRWSAAAADFPSGQTIHELFEQRVTDSPESEALVAGAARFSYRELNVRANRLAQELRSQGVQTETPVALCARRTADSIVATLAVLKAGGCVVPLDPGYPRERLRFMVQDSGATLLLHEPADSALVSSLELAEVASFDLGESSLHSSSAVITDLPSAAHPQSLAYLLYTSGTTGVPKGVELTHTGFVNYIHQLGKKTGISSADRILQFASPSFDIAVEESLAALLHGATLVLRERDMSQSLHEFASGCTRNSISWLSLPTAWWHEVCEGLQRGEFSLPASIRCVVIGGEKAELEAFRKWRSHTHGVRLFNTYGPTETSIVAAWCELTHLDPTDCVDIPIGKPVPNVRIWVMDADMHPLPPGLPGELFIGGVGVARGYHHRDELNAERFFNYIATDGSTHKLYKTGDRGRYLADGKLAFLGRADQQLKIRGHRVEPAEIEAVLGSVAGVGRCAVVPLGVAPAIRLVAYLTGDVVTHQLPALLRATLPEYMIPNDFVVLEQLPFTANGKLDRAALPLPEVESESTAEYVEPLSAVEIEVARIWSEVLGVARVGLHENFFALGGHSLIATRVMSRIRSNLSSAIPLRAIFDWPTVVELAAAIDKHKQVLDDFPVRRKSAADGLPPLSSAQQRLWVLDRLEPGNSTYNLYTATKFEGDLSLSSLQSAVDGLTDRHEILRTRFPELDGEPAQFIESGIRVPIQVHELAEQDDASVQRSLKELIDEPFDLSRGPLFRVHVLRLCHPDGQPQTSVLLLLMHHIVSDGWSVGVLNRELQALYSADREQRSADLPELPVQYADYAYWQREQLSRPEFTAHEVYWKQRLAGAPPLLELPLDYPRPSMQSFTGAWVSTVLAPALLKKLNRRAAEEGATLFMALLAAFKVLLARYSGRSDVLVGVPVAGRSRTELEPLIGCFLNTLVMRTDLGSNPTFRDSLERVRQTALDAFEHQDLPFENLLDILQSPRSTSYTPVIQVLFNFHSEASGRLQLPGLVSKSILLDRAAAKFDLSISIVETDAGLRTGIEYNTALFKRDTANQLLQQFGLLLEGLANHPEQSVAKLPLIGAVPDQMPVCQQNFVPFDAGSYAGIAGRFRAVVGLFPDRPAVEVSGATCSYAQLDELSNRVARDLRIAGARSGDRIAVLLGHDINMTAGLLGVLKAGGAYVPLDRHAPAARHQSILLEAQAKFLLADSAHMALVGPLVSPQLPLITVPSDSGDSSNTFSGEESDSEFAYVLFTSGSTGIPKGVLQTQRNVLQHVSVYTNALQICADDRLTLFSSYGFDAAVMDIFGALLNGACLCPVDLTAGLSDREIAAALSSVTLLHATPTVFRHLLRVTTTKNELQTVRAVVLGGEEARPGDFELFCERFGPDAVFVNGLGPSESTLATQFIATRDSHPRGQAIPIGRAVAGTEIVLLDDSGGEAGFSGEIAIRSRYLSVGYLNQLELTRERFLPDPEEPGLFTYRTGDLARYLPNGDLVYQGRADSQIKVRGHRVEPGEVETALMRSPNIERCAVVQRSGRLIAFFTGAAEAQLERNRLKTLLPAYMVPDLLQKLDALPLLSNGKLDYSALPEVAEAYPGQVRVEPRDEVEQCLHDIWAELLGCELLDVHEDFFSAGGHSLLATRLLARVRDKFSVSISLRAFFAAPTIAELADLLQQSVLSTDVPLVRRPADDKALPPLSWSQQRLWFLDQLEPQSATYNIHWAGRIRGEVDSNVLEAALRELLARHESLRTSFVIHAGEPFQAVSAGVPLRLSREALPGADDEQVKAKILDLVSRPFDLREAPLFRAHLLQLADSDAVLLLVTHHIISDGWSMGVLFRELSEIYAARLLGAVPDLPELPLDYADYSVWQRAWLSGDELERQVGYWRAQLDAAPPLLEMPKDHPRPPVRRNRGAWVSKHFSPILLAGLNQLGRDRGATLFMVLLAAFKVLILRHTGRNDILVGSPVAGRGRTELEGLIGFFLNTLVLRSSVDSGLTFSQLLDRVRSTTLDAYDHQELPFEKLLEAIKPARSTAHTPIVQILFNLHNEPSEGFSLAGSTVDVMNIARGTSKFDLSVALIESRSGLHVGFEYNSDIYDAETVSGFLRNYGELLEQVVADSGRGIADYLLSGGQSQPRPAARITSTLVSASSLILIDQFHAMVAAHPDSPAVHTEKETVSYRELNERANGVAAMLVQYRAAGSRRAGLLLGHDVSMVVGLLAALKAGFTYVPLDVHAPPARIGSVIDEADLAVIIADPDHGRLLLKANADSVSVVEISSGSQRLSAAPMVSSLPDDIAYVLFTSGSTGKPKGIMQSQRNVLHHVRTYSNALKIGNDDRLSLLSAYGFDAAVMDIFGALLNGACLHPLDLRSEEYPGELLDRMAIDKVTLLHATPTLFRYLMRSKVCRHDLGAVRAVILGGEEARGSDFELFKRQFSAPTLFVNGLGPSESTLATQFFANHQTKLPGGVVPIGTPVDGTEILLLNDAGEVTNFSGEIAIRSRYVAKGYWRQPELTAERFIVDWKSPDYTLYRSGDLARRLPDGSLVFLGRKDDQVKVRGHRVELGDIEAALLRQAGVESAAVVLRNDDGGTSFLAAYIVGDVSEQDLRRVLKIVLPDYMLPSAYVSVMELPLTPNGKLDRRALPVPDRSVGISLTYTAPRTDTEQQLASIWSEILGIPRVGIHDDFFELGGHSLLAAQLAARINESLRVVVPLRRLFDSPTVAEVAEHIETLQWALLDRPDNRDLH